jgi:hypothetical protein
MPHGNTLSRMLIAGIAAAIIAAPTAMAQPINPVTIAQPEPEASINQEQRTEHAKQQADAVSPSPKTADLRSEAAKDPSRAPAPPRPLPGPPTWPMHPRVLTPPTTTAVADDGDGGGVEAPIVALIIAGALALAGGLTVAMHRQRRTHVAH